MLDLDKTRERVLMLQRLRELTTIRIEQETANQLRLWKLLEERHRATVERLSASKIAGSSHTS